MRLVTVRFLGVKARGRCAVHVAQCKVQSAHCAGHRSRRTYTTYNTSFCAYLYRYLYVIVSSAYLCRYLYVAKTRPSEWSVTWTPPQLSNPIHFSQTASSSSPSSSSPTSASDHGYLQQHHYHLHRHQHQNHHANYEVVKVNRVQVQLVFKPRKLQHFY